MIESIKTPKIDNMDKIIQNLYYFYNNDYKFYKLDEKLPLDPYIYSNKISSFISNIYDEKFIYPFSWAVGAKRHKNILKTTKILKNRYSSH